MKSKFRVWLIALLGMMILGVADAYASSGTSYSRARAFLKEGSPTAGGKVYVGGGEKSSSPGTYVNCTSSTSPATTDKKKGASAATTYHFWAQANTGYKFTGWYSKNASGVYTLASSNAHYSVSVTSGAAPSSGTEYTDKDLYAEFIKVIQLSFIVPTNGSYTITHKGAAVADYATFTVDGPVKLTATPAAGYKLRGWYTSTDGGKTKSYFAFGNTCEPNFTADKTIGADFVLDDGKATFWPKGSTKVFEDLNAAVSATSSGGIIVVVSDGTLAAGDYTINKSITLLLPYSTTNSKMTTPAVVHVTAAGSAPALSVYRKLTLAPGANITVESGSSICLGGSIASVNGGNNSSFPCGPSGVLDLSQGGEVTLNSGAALYAWGFVQGQNMDQGNNTSGVGHITARSGSTVWEDYQVGDWRGGTASSSIYSSRSSWKFFPFQSWTIQNIEAPITYEYGANGKCYWTIFGDGSVHYVTFDYVASSTSLFTLAAEGATLDKWYDPTTDKVVYQVDGTTKVDAITLSALGYTITTSEYNLPVPCNMSIVLKGGTFTAANSIIMHSGSSLEVKAGASFALNTNLYLFDQSEWGKYCMYYGGSDVYFQKFNTLTKHYDRGDRTSKAGLEDATLVVDGTIVVNSSKGKLYSTASGSKIVGNGGGVIRFAGSLPSSTSITMCTNLKNTSSVSMANANLLNENGTYTKVKGSSYFDNVNGRWFIRAAKKPKTDHTWDFTYIKSGSKNGTGGTDAVVSAVYSNDKTGDEDRMRWANVDDDSCDDWWKGLDAGQTSYYYHYQSSAWHQFIPVSGMSGHYSGSDGKLYQKSGCDWTEPSIPYEGCLYTIDAVQKALVDGAFVQVVPNDPNDHAWHKSGAASTYYICLPGCVWKAATRIAGYSQAYTTTRDSKQYIWYEDKWLEATEDAPFFCARIDNKKKYFEFVDGAWTLMDPLADVTISGETTEYVRFSDVMTAINGATANPTVRLLKNINLTSGVTYSNNKQVTFNLNGFTLSGEVNELITIDNASAIFIVIDGSTGGTGKIDMTFAKADARSTAINITSGHLMLNSGTIHAENTDSATCAIHVASGQKFTMNGGRIEAVSVHNTWGVHLTSNATPIPEMVVIKGGTIDVTASATTTALAYGIYSEGGLAKVDGGTIIANAPSCSGSSYGASGIYLSNAKSRLTVNGGTIRGASNSYARSIYGYSSSSEATINGGVLEATATGSTAQAIRVNGKVTINEGAIVRANSSSSARGIYTYNTNAKVWVNGGKFYVTTSGNDACGVYSQIGKDTINGGEFYVTSKGTSAYGVFAYETASTVNICVADGKFMIKSKGTDSIQYASCNNTTHSSTAVPAANISIRGGYWNIDKNLSGYIGTKVVKDLDETLEADLIAAGYKYKVRGVERTVTWKNKGGAVLKTEKVEEEKVPVYTGATPSYTSSTQTYRFIGWAATDGGAVLSPLPAVGASDVTYFARYETLYAEVTTGGVTTRYNSAQTAWTEAQKHTQATMRLLSNLGTESGIGNMTQMVFDPTNANSIITIDLNGHSWTMGNHATAEKNTSPFLHVNPTQTGCKLIITDNSASGNGYLMNSWEKTDGDLRCVLVSKGELVLQKGGLKVKNKASDKYSNGVYVSGDNAHFTMTGGTVYSTDGTSPRGVCIGNGFADIAAGTIEAHSTAGEAYALLSYDTVSVSADAVIKATGDAGSAYGLYCNGASAILTVDSCTVESKGTGWVQGVYAISGGKIVIDGNPTISSMTTTTSGAHGVFATGANTNITVNSGTFTVKAVTTAARGIYAGNTGTATIKGGSFNVTSEYDGDPSSFGAYTEGGTINIEGGNFTLNVVKANQNADLVRCGPSATAYLNVSGGTFTSEKAFYGVRSFGGETTVTGNPVFTAHRGIGAGEWASATGTAKVTIDGGTYNCTVGYALLSTTHTHGTTGDVVTGDVTVLDGKFHTLSSVQPIDASKSTDYLKIKGGYFTSYTSSNVSNLNKYVVAPSTSEELTSGSEFDAGYKYHVICNHAIIWNWNDGKTKSRTDQVLHNTMPDFGGIPTHTGTDTYEFLGWNTKEDGSGDTVMIAKADTTYYAQWRKWEAEVYEGDSEEPIRYEKFTDAFNAAQNMHVARIKVLSNVSEATSWVLNPDSVGGSQPLTLDLNNHKVNCTIYQKNNEYALTINKEGCKLIIDDSSIAKGGLFGHSRTTKATDKTLRGVYLQNGELELAGGTLWAQNITADITEDAGVYTVVAESGTVFTQTGGRLLAQCKHNTYAYHTSGTGIYNITGGRIEVTSKYTVSSTDYYGTAAYGVYLNNYGTFNMSGTATMSVTTGTGAYGVYVYGGGGSGYPVANMSGGSITCLTKTGQASRAIQVHGTHASANISGGTLTANSSEDSERWNVEDVACTGGAEVTVTGGNFHSTTGASCIGVRVFNGTATIGGTAYFDSRHGVVVGDWAEADGTVATATINGGTFNCPDYVLFANETSHDDKTVTGTMYVNGGYFKTASGKICGTTSGVGRLVLNGGYYNETSSTTQKTNITTYKGGSATVQDLASTDPAYSDGYRYHISTPYTVTWVYGDVSESETVDCGVMPSKDLTTYTYGGKIYYVTGWSPALSVVTGNITYTAVSAAYEAAVTVDETTTRYTSFSDAWEYALTQEEATITLLNNVDLSAQKTYAPTVDSARHTLDLNNFTIAYSGTGSWAIKVNRADAQLTITDNSVGAGGKLQNHVDRDGTSYAVSVVSGELVLAGGEISARNGTTEKRAHGVNVSAGGTFTMTGGTLRACSYAARAINTSAACTINISGGHIIASTELTEDTWSNYAYGVYSSGAATITISGSPVIDVDARKGAYGIVAGSGSSTNATINGGTVNVTTHVSTTAYCCYASASSTMTINGGVFNATSATSEADGARVTETASMTINGGTFNSVAGTSTCFGAYTSSTEPFYITGGTFNVNRVDNTTNADYFDVVRVQPGANAVISGGSFNTGAKKGYGVYAWGGSTTISGNPTFTARIGVIAGYKCEDTGSDTCTATVVINGGMFDVSSYAVYAAWDTSDPTKGSNLVNSDITINGGHFKSTGEKIVYEKADGDGTAALTINGGYFNEKSGSTYKDQIDDFVTSPREVYAIESSDPNYEDGYRYRVTEHPVASVKTGSEITYYTTAKAALDYAKTVADPTITLLGDCSLTEANYMINPAGTWTCTLDLNNHTLTPTVDGSLGRAFTIGGTNAKLIVTDNSENKGGQIYYKGNSSVSIIYFVMGANAELELAGGTLYVENTSDSKKAVGFVVDHATARFTQSGGTFTIKGAYGATGYYGGGTATFTGGTMNVDGGAHQAIGLFPQESTSVLNVSGTFALNVTSSLADSYGVLVKNSGATGTISGGKFKFDKNTIVAAQSSGSLTITGGYFVEKSGTTYKSQINSYVSSPYEIYEISSADPNYPEYSYCVTNGHPVASVQTGDEMSHYTTVLAAMNYARTVEDPTITILEDASLTARWSISSASATIPDNWHGILDLNGHTVTGAGSDYEMITVGKAGIKLTIRDSSVGQTGKITHEESTRDKVWGVNVSHGELELKSGTIYVKNSKAGVDAVGVCTNINEDAVLTMKGGKVETHSAINAKALYLYGGSATISGGKVIAITELNGTIGATAYGIYMDKPSAAPAPSLTVSGADSIYAKAGTATNERAYALYAYKGTATIGGTPYFIAESPEGGARVLQSSGTGSVTVNGGTFEAKTTTSDSYALIAEGSSTMTANGGKFKTNQNNITYHNSGAGATLTINGGYFNENSGTNHKTRITSYATASGKAVIDLDTDDAEYKAGYRYIVTDDPVAKVKEGSTVTYYTTIDEAIEAANGMDTNPTVTMLDDVTTTQLTITAAMTLDLNGKTIRSTQTTAKKGVFAINASGQTITIQDSGSGGKIEHEATVSGYLYGIYLLAGSLNMTGGTIYAKNEVTTEDKNYRAYGIYTPESATTSSITISGGTIEAYSPYTQRPLGILAYGNLTMTGGTVVADGLFYARGIYAAGATTSLTDVTVTTNSTDSISYAVQAAAGNVVINSGTYTATAGNKYAYAIYDAASTLTVNNGTFTANGETTVYTVYKTAGTLTINNGSFTADGEESLVYSIYDYTGTVTINNGTYTSTGITINTRSSSNVNLTVNDGKFSGTTKELYKGSKATVSIRGGYYVHNTTVKDCVTEPYYIFSESLTEGGITYNYRVAEAYTLTWSTDGDALTGTYTSGLTEVGTTITAPNTPTKTGYTFAAWDPAVAATMPAANTTYTATWTPNTNTAYTVEHYKQNLAGDGYDLADTDNLTGTTAAEVTPTVKSYEGFTAPSTQTVTILADGSLVVTYNYTRNSYTLAWALDGGSIETPGTTAGSVKYGASLTAPTVTKSGYVFNAWSPSVPATMPAANSTYTATWTAAEASVTESGVTTDYETFGEAWNAANSATAASTIKLLKAATVTTQLTYDNENDQNCTLDLNGFTLTSTTDVQRPLYINNADVTFTITDSLEGKAGKLSITTSYSGEIFGANVYKGTLIHEAGTIEVSSGSQTTCGVTVSKNAYFTMNGGTIHVVTTNSKEGRGVYANGITTINAGSTIDVDAAGDAYGIYFYSASSRTVTVNGGKFDITGSTAAKSYLCDTKLANTNVLLKGGWFTTKLMSDGNNIETKYVAPGKSCTYSVFDLADESPYLYEIAEATYTVTFDKEGGSEGDNSVAATYSVDMPTVTPPTRENYEFGGYWDGDNGTGIQYYNADGTSARTWDKTSNTTLYAKWTEAVASVTINGNTKYYAAFTGDGSAWAAANSASKAPTITMLQDVEGISEHLNYKNALNCTLDLNGHSIAGTANQLLYVNCSDKTFTIENTGGSENGKISLEIGGTAYTYCVYVNNGTLQLNAGTIYHHSTQTDKNAYAVYVKSSRAFTMNGGKVHVVTTARPAYGLYSYGTTEINDGEIVVESSSYGYGVTTISGTTDVKGGKIKVTSSDKYAYGIDCRNGTATVSTSDSIIVSGIRAYGGYVGGFTPTATASYNGTLEIESGIFKVTSTTDKAYGVNVYSGKDETDAYHDAGTANISGGTFIVEAQATSQYAYGVYVAAATGEPVATPKATITGGKFNVTAATTSRACAMNNAAADTALVVEGGFYSTKKMNSGNIEDKYTATTKSCKYHVFPVSPALEDVYNWKVAEGYTLTWDLDGGTVTTAGTGAAVDATGTPSIAWGVGDAITAPVIERDGYTFAGWSPEVAATMPAENTTYTAVWAEAEVTINGVTTPYAKFYDSGAMGEAWYAANASRFNPATIKLLQDVAVDEQLLYNNSFGQNCTLDLNGHTITSTTAVQSPLSISCSGSTFIITDNTDSKLGKLSMTTSYEAAGVIFGAYVGAGTLQLDGGTLEVIVSSGTKHTCGVSVVSSFIMNGGTIHVNNTNGYDGRGVYFNGSVTINDGTIHVESTGNGYGFKRDAGTITVNGGKFNINGATANINHTESVSGGVTIRGGWYNTNNRLNAFVTTPYHVFDLAGQSPYLYEVAEGYNLTWDLDGGAISVAGTPAGYVKVGTVVTAPTVTKTGYDFNAWSPAVVSPMPEANKTYTATWTPTTYTLSYDLDGGSVASGNPTSYTIESSAITLNNPTKAGYVFAGWTGTGLASATMTVTISAGSTGNRSYTATWTEAKASVTDGGATTYYTTVAAAVAAANATSGATVKMLKNASTNEVEIKATMTIDLNGKTISSTQTDNAKGVFKMNASGKTLTIRDSGTGGKIDHTATISGGSVVGIYVAAGSLRMESGIIYAKNPSTTNSSQAFGIATNSSCGLTMTGGTVTAEAYKEARGLWLNGTTSLTNATITSTSTNDISYAVQANAGALTVHSGTYTATGTTGYAVRERAGTVSIEGGKFSGSTQDFVKEGGTASITGGYYVHDTDIQDNCADNYYVVSTTEEVGYNYKVAEVANTGFYADIVDVDNTNSKLIINVTSWAVNGWPYNINGVLYYKDKTTADAASSTLYREADRTLKIPYVGEPGENFAMKVQKTGGDVVSHRLYVIPQEIKSNTTISENQTKNLYVKGATLTVNGNITAHNIYVAPDAKLTINGSKTLTADTIFLRTTADHAAEMENKGTIAGTTKLVYTRIIKDKDFHFFGIPLSCDVEDVHLSDGIVPMYTTGWVLRSYDESRRAQSGADEHNWVTLAADRTIAGGAGYEMFSASQFYREFYFPVDLSGLTDQVAVAYTSDGAAGEKQAGWNAITSPFTHTYANAKVPEGLAVNWYADGYYSQEIPTSIPPATVFAFQATKTGYISFEGSSIVDRMPRRATEEEVRIQWMEVDIEDANGVGDHTNIYSHPDRYESSYQTGIDIAKQSLTAPRAIIYSSHAYGDMAFAGVADSLLEQGVALTVYSPSAQELTFSMRDNDWLNRMEYVWLIDHQTGARTDLLWDTYTYDATEGTTRGRFTIQGIFRTPQVATDIEPTSDSSLKGREEVRKVIINQKMYILIGDQMYDATGKKVSK